MGFTVAVKVENLAQAEALVRAPGERPGIMLVPNVESYGTVKATVKDFIRRNLFIPDELQVLQAPLFRRLSEKESVEEVYKRYACQAEIDTPELHLDEDNFAFFAREGGRTVDLDETRRLEEYHIVEKQSVVRLRRLPQALAEAGGRVFVETKDGILPVLGVRGSTRVLDLKRELERMTGIPAEQQLLSSVGRSMHDGLRVDDFQGPHRVCEDSTLDLCRSGDTSADQGHLRMVIGVSVMGEQSFTMVVQGRDLVRSVQEVVEARTGVSTWQQRVTYSGKILHEKRPLSEYFVHPDCTLQVTVFRSPCKPPPSKAAAVAAAFSLSGENNSGAADQQQRPAARKIKLLRTSKGRVIGTVTIPILTTDTVADLKRKVRRTLQPLTERNFVVLRTPSGTPPGGGGGAGPKVTPSPKGGGGDPFSTSGRRLSRVLSFTGRTLSSITPPGGSASANATPTSSMPVAFSIPPPPSSAPPAMAERSNGGGSGGGGSGGGGKKVARVLSFKNFSGPLVSPSKPAHHRAPAPAPAPAPLFPPPLSIPQPGGASTDSAAPAHRKSSAEDKGGGPFTPRSATNSAAPKAPPLTRAMSMGHLSSVPAPLPAIPAHLLQQPPTAENVVPAAAAPLEPIPDAATPSSSSSISPNSASSGSSRGSDVRAKEPVTPPPPPAGHSSAEKKGGLGAWLTGSIKELKEHIKSPFMER